MGSSLNAVLSPLVAKHFKKEDPSTHWNVGGPLFLGLIFMTFSLGMAFLLAIIDRRTEKGERVQHESALLSQSYEEDINRTKKKSRTNSEIKSVKVSETSQLGDIEASSKQEGGGNEHLDFKAIKNLPSTFWLLMLIAMLSEALFIPFLDNGNKYYQKVFKGI